MNIEIFEENNKIFAKVINENYYKFFYIYNKDTNEWQRIKYEKDEWIRINQFINIADELFDELSKAKEEYFKKV